MTYQSCHSHVVRNNLDKECVSFAFFFKHLLKTKYLPVWSRTTFLAITNLCEMIKMGSDVNVQSFLDHPLFLNYKQKFNVHVFGELQATQLVVLFLFLCGLSLNHWWARLDDSDHFQYSVGHLSDYVKQRPKLEYL